MGYEVMWEARNCQGQPTTIRGARISRSAHKRFESPCEKILIDEDSRVIGIVHAFGKVTVECGLLDEATGRLDSRLHNFNLALASLAPIGCFSLVDPSTLYKQILP